MYLGFLLVSYSSAINRLDRQFEESTFPKLIELIDYRIDLFFKPSLKGLSLLSETLDWPVIMQNAASDARWLKAHMKSWATELEAISVGVSDRNRKIVWDYWSEKPVTLNPALPRDAWFFDFWKNKQKTDWVFTLYSEDSAGDYQLYIDRLIHDRSGNSIGSIAAKISLSRLREQISQIINKGERVIILDDKSDTVIDISSMKVGEGVRTFGFDNSSVEGKKNADDILIKKILAQANDRGRLHSADENVFYKRTTLFNGALSVLTVLDGDYLLKIEKERLIKDLIFSFGSFTLFIGGMLIAMMFFTQSLKSLAIKLETDKSKFEDLLFIITHGFANEILHLQKSLSGIPNRISTGIYLRLCEMSLMIQNSVNAARLDNTRSFIINKPYDFSWQWDKLTGNFKPLAAGKGQSFTASPAIDCIINNDEEMVYQILANLVSNAVKYAPKGGKVKINASVEGGSLFITICDSGPGFLPEDREALFTKFRKLSARPSGKERSTGLGLYIAKQLADSCNIKLTLSQGEGVLCGARWELEFPIAQSLM